jgi:N-acetylmuramoyl-L-alanine amidase
MKYVTRSDWGAIDTGKRLKGFWRPVQGIVIHHTTGPSHGPWGRVRGHDRYHVHTKGWDSIAYNWLVSGETGEIFEGRGWKRGAATRGWNSKTISVAYIGDSDDGLTERGKDSILTAVGAARGRYGDHLWIKCHKDFSQTTCPGETLTEWVHSGMTAEQPHTNTIIDWAAILRYVTEAGLTYVIDRPIKRGSTGKWVSIAQQRLNDRTNAGLKVDGIYGKKSVAACKRFQSQFAIEVNGIVDADTWKVLWVA